jgi:hypothetical protein
VKKRGSLKKIVIYAEREHAGAEQSSPDSARAASLYLRKTKKKGVLALRRSNLPYGKYFS